MLKVVHVVEALGGGVNTYFKDLSSFFGNPIINASTETTIIYSKNRNEINSLTVENEFSPGVNLINLNMVRGFSPITDFKSIIKLRKELKRIKPDIIHLHSSKAGVLGRVANFLLFDDKKVFYTPHGYAFIRTDISMLSKKIYWLIEKYFIRFFKGTTIACGDTEYEIAKKIGPSLLVRNGIDINKVQSFSNEHKNSIITIGIVGRITYARNPKLFNEIALRFPQYNFVWIGDGELKHLITAPNIKVTGWFFDQTKALQELNKLDIYIQTSLWEGLPIAVLEAMILKKPIVATNVIGNKDIVIHKENGFLFNEIEELDSIFEELQHLEKRTFYAEKASNRCKLLFDKNKNFSELLNIYQKAN